MAKVRIGFSTQFEVENEKVGIGTDSALDTLHVTGDIIAHNIDAGGGITTVVTYDGFVDKEVKVTNPDINLNSQSNSLSGEIVIEGTVNVSSGTTFTSGPENLTVTDNFTLPGISDDKPTVGTMRFNENLGSLEFYTGVEWRAVNSRVDIDGGGSRGIIAGGYGPSLGAPAPQRKEIEYFNTATQGNSQYFGDLTDKALADDGAGNEIRCLIYHQVLSGIEQHIDYFPYATQGNGVDFGNLDDTSRFRSCSVSSSTRALWCGGKTPSYVNDISYVEIMTTGNSEDFGDLMNTAAGAASGMSPTRGIIAGGILSVSPTVDYTSEMSFVTMASKGNSTPFGNLSFTGGYGDGGSSSTRALFAGGYDQGNARNQQRISAVTIASEGNAINFGDLHVGKAWNWGAGTQSRGFFGGGNAFPSQDHYNIIEYVSMNSGGQALDFGDMIAGAYAAAGITNAHGGLGGF